MKSGAIDDQPTRRPACEEAFHQSAPEFAGYGNKAEGPLSHLPRKMHGRPLRSRFFPIQNGEREHHCGEHGPRFGDAEALGTV
jgi:hypothetical protein